MKIHITHEYDTYYAIDDDTYDGPPSPVGSGLTERAAIEDLFEQIIDMFEARIDKLRLRRLEHIQNASDALIPLPQDPNP